VLTITPLQALSIGLLYYVANTSFLAGQAYFTTWRPLVNGALAGLILGDVQQGILIGALVNMLYLGYMSVGGTLGIGDAALAGILGAAVGVALDSPGIGVLVGVATASLGYQLLVLRMRGADAIARRIDDAAARGDVAGMLRWHIGAAQAWLFILTVPTAALLGWAAPAVTRIVLDALPTWLVGGLELGGRIAPLLGLGLALKFVLGERMRVNTALFVAAAAATAFGLPFPWLAAAAIVGVAASVLRAPRPARPAGDDAAWTSAARATFLHWQFFSHSNYSFSKLQGSGLGCALAAALRATPAAVQRHAGFFNTEVNFGTLIPAALLRMEQQGATPEEIARTRQALMSAVAGFGDEITQGAFLPAVLAVAIGLALTPQIGGAAVAAYVGVVAALMFGIAWTSFRAGLRHGKHAASLLFADERLKAAATAARSVTAAAAGALAVHSAALTSQPLLDTPFGLAAAIALPLGAHLLLQRTGIRPLWPFLALVALGVGLAAVR
jgi:mannose/fructose/N-acetylgalactosamine-specific phosphotransferase system component IIC/mannose/fructose/N-acetylgalactosamine-specific phosphotransferase system component IID